MFSFPHSRHNTLDNVTRGLNRREQLRSLAPTSRRNSSPVSRRSPQARPTAEPCSATDDLRWRTPAWPICYRVLALRKQSPTSRSWTRFIRLRRRRWSCMTSVRNRALRWLSSTLTPGTGRRWRRPSDVPSTRIRTIRRSIAGATSCWIRTDVIKKAWRCASSVRALLSVQ